eukprot:4829371-Pyramimonas_sp.AAC.1
MSRRSFVAALPRPARGHALAVVVAALQRRGAAVALRAEVAVVLLVVGPAATENLEPWHVRIAWPHITEGTVDATANAPATRRALHGAPDGAVGDSTGQPAAENLQRDL